MRNNGRQAITDTITIELTWCPNYHTQVGRAVQNLVRAKDNTMISLLSRGPLGEGENSQRRSQWICILRWCVVLRPEPALGPSGLLSSRHYFQNIHEAHIIFQRSWKHSLYIVWTLNTWEPWLQTYHKKTIRSIDSKPYDKLILLALAKS